MQTRLIEATVVLAVLFALLGVPVSAQQTSLETPAMEVSEGTRAQREARAVERLASIVQRIEPISKETQWRRSLAQATFCLPQNVLGILTYAVAQAIGGVLHAGRMNEVTVVVTRLPFGVSLGRYLFVPDVMLTERAVRHEYGHTMQGYRHGPFYLLLEGVTSFAMATAALFSPAIADGYYDRWPENEADTLGGAR